MSLTTGIITNNGEGGPTITTITSSTTLTEHFDIIKIDGSSGSDIEIKLPDDTSIFLDRNPTKFTRIDRCRP